MPTDRQLHVMGIVVAVAFGISGWPTAWYFYRASLPTRIPTFQVDPVRTVLAAETPDISIQYKGKSIGEKAVNVVRVYFWNAGNTPIIEANNDILQPFTITIPGDSQILDTKILTASRFTGVTFDLQERNPNTANVKIKLLEPGRGATLKITYAGPKDAKLEFDGATIGASSPLVIEIPNYSEKLFKSLLSLAKLVRRIKFLFLGLVIILSSPIFIPFIRNFIYQKLFLSKKTPREIGDSAMRTLLPAIVVLIVVDLGLLLIIPPEVTGVPLELIVKD